MIMVDAYHLNSPTECRCSYNRFVSEVPNSVHKRKSLPYWNLNEYAPCSRIKSTSQVYRSTFRDFAYH